MSLLFPKVAYHHPARYGPAVVSRQELGPVFSLFDDALNDLTRASHHLQRQFNNDNKTWNPSFDVKEEKDSYTIEAEVPGVEQKDLSIEFTDEHTIQIKGRHERHTESGTRPSQASAIEDEKPAAAIEDGTATPASETAETTSTKSHQATVSDGEPANSSAVAAEAEKSADAPTTITSAVARQPAEKQQQQQLAEAPPKSQSQYWISERSSGSFTRSFAFPVPVNQEAVKASLKNGVLTINVPKVPKLPKPKSRRVQIE